MEIWYTARKKFDEKHSEPDFWGRYINWARLFQVKELIGLDSSLSELAFQFDAEDASTYEYLIIDELYSTDLFNSLQYVLSKIAGSAGLNLLAVLKNPECDCSGFAIDSFHFLGYELLDQYYDHSALTNCGGFDETFLPSGLNEYGLLSQYERAVEVQQGLIANNPKEDHAHCNLFGIWRHVTIGKDFTL